MSSLNSAFIASCRKTVRVLEEESSVQAHNSDIVGIKNLVYGGRYEEIVKAVEAMPLSEDRKRVGTRGGGC